MVLIFLNIAMLLLVSGRVYQFYGACGHQGICAPETMAMAGEKADEPDSQCEQGAAVAVETNAVQSGQETFAKTKGKIAITFDDGPYPGLTEQLLDGLQEEEVKATFFILGQSAQRYPDVVKRTYDEGHLVGNHTYNHLQLTAVPKNQAVEEITKTNTLLYEITGEYPKFVRAPFGCWTQSLEDAVDMLHVKWSVDPRDWNRTDVDQMVREVVDGICDHDIILFHDCYPSSVEAALRIIRELKEQGYEFVTVDEFYSDEK